MKDMISRCAVALQKNGMNCIVAESRGDVPTILGSLLKDGDRIGSGGSVTLQQCGVYDLLKCGRYTYYDRADAKNADEVRDCMVKAYDCDVYMLSANAITETGTIYNVDGRANRVSAMCFGAKRVIIVAGVNKIVPTIADAVYRVKTVAAPLNCRRLGMKTYCAETGRCVSLNKENPEMTDGCGSDQRICCDYVLLGKQREAGRITVILVNEELGY